MSPRAQDDLDAEALEDAVEDDGTTVTDFLGIMDLHDPADEVRYPAWTEADPETGEVP